MQLRIMFVCTFEACIQNLILYLTQDSDKIMESCVRHGCRAVEEFFVLYYIIFFFYTQLIFLIQCMVLKRISILAFSSSYQTLLSCGFKIKWLLSFILYLFFFIDHQLCFLCYFIKFVFTLLFIYDKNRFHPPSFSVMGKIATQPLSREASNYDEVFMQQSLLFDDSLKVTSNHCLLFFFFFLIFCS